jgi:hypothetical protein
MDKKCCENCEYFEQPPREKNLTIGHCILKEVNRQRVKMVNIQDYCKYHSKNNRLPPEAVTKMFKEHKCQKKHWHLNHLKNEQEELEIRMDKRDKNLTDRDYERYLELDDEMKKVNDSIDEDEKNI